MHERNPVVWFEIPVRDLDRAIHFYSSVLQITMNRQDFGTLQMAWFPSLPDGSGATGALVQAETYIPSHHGSMVYLSVADIDSTLDQLSQHGGKIINPKRSIGEFGFVAHFEDSEGNRVALHSDQ